MEKVSPKRIASGIENLLMLRTYLSFMFPANSAPKERILKVFVSHLLANKSCENETIRLNVMSFLQDKVSFIKQKTGGFYKLLRLNPFETISGLIVPVDDTKIKTLYRPVQDYFEAGEQGTVAQLHAKCKPEEPATFFYTAMGFTNEMIKVNFTGHRKQREAVTTKIRDYARKTNLSTAQKTFLGQIEDSFGSSDILTLKNVKKVPLEFKLYVICALAVFHSISDKSNFLRQIGVQILTNKIKAVFLNISNMFDVSARAKVEVTKLWKCKNCGNVFGLGNCGRPWEVFKCVCGVDIGGTKHVATPNTIELTPEEQKRYSPRADKYNIHEYLRDSHKTFLNIHPLCFRFLHSFVHALYLGWIETGYVPLTQMAGLLLPNLDSDFQHMRVADKRDYFLRHIEVDFEVIQSMRNKNYREYNLLTSLLVNLFDNLSGFTGCQETMEGFNTIAANIGESFGQLITGNNQLSIEAKIDKFLRESSTKVRNEEAEIVLRSLDFAKVSEHRLNEYLFLHLRNIARPSVASFVEYMNHNVELREKARFMEFHINYRGLLDTRLVEAFTGINDMLVFMNAHLQNEFKKEIMSQLRVTDFVRQCGNGY